MASFKFFPDRVEQSGAGVMAFASELDGLRHVGLRILARHGIVDPEPSKWYPLQGFLDALRELSAFSGPATLKAIGMRMPDHAHWPIEVHSVEAAMWAVDAAHHLNIRGGDVGHYQYSQASARSGQMACDGPYPCPVDCGILERVMQKFAGSGTTAGHVWSHPDPCRDLSGESCTYHLKW